MLRVYGFCDARGQELNVEVGPGGMEIHLVSKPGPIEIRWEVDTPPTAFIENLRGALSGHLTGGVISSEKKEVAYTLTPGYVVRGKFTRGTGSWVRVVWSTSGDDAKLDLVISDVLTLAKLLEDFWTEARGGN